MIQLFTILFAISITSLHAQNDFLSQNEFLTDSLVNRTCKNLGASYKYGASGMNSFDCSGLVNFHFNKKNFPRSSKEIAKLGAYVEADSLQVGDLIFFLGSNLKDIGHVAIVSHISDKDIFILHATTKRGVIEEILQHNSYFMKRWVFNKRIDLQD